MQWLNKRNLNIRSEYIRLYSKGYRSDVIYRRLADRFYLAESTIEHIVFERGHYKATSSATV